MLRGDFWPPDTNDPAVLENSKKKNLHMFFKNKNIFGCNQ
jgi:hypothetical protein